MLKRTKHPGRSRKDPAGQPRLASQCTVPPLSEVPPLTQLPPITCLPHPVVEGTFTEPTMVLLYVDLANFCGIYQLSYLIKRTSLLVSVSEGFHIALLPQHDSFGSLVQIPRDLHCALGPHPELAPQKMLTTEGLTAKSVCGKRAREAQKELPPAAARRGSRRCTRPHGVCVCVGRGWLKRSHAVLTAAITEAADAVHKFSFQLLLSTE